MNNFWDKYLLIFGTTWHILREPLAFGQTLTGDPAETKRAMKYLGEGVILFYGLFQLANMGSETELPLSSIPFSGEILAAVMIVSVLLTALFTHPVALWFSGNPTSIHGSLAPFLYWSGFCLFVMPIAFTALIISARWLFDTLNFSEDMMLLTFMVLSVPPFFVYYIGTISTWIGNTYRMEPLLGGISVFIAYMIMSAVGAGLAAAGSALLKMFA